MKQYLLALAILASGCQAKKSAPSAPGPQSIQSIQAKTPPTAQPQAPAASGLSSSAPTAGASLGGETQNGDWTYAERARKLLNEVKQELVAKIQRAHEGGLYATAFKDSDSKLVPLYSAMSPREFKRWMEVHIQQVRQKDNSELASFSAGVRNFFYSVDHDECSVEAQPIYYVNFGVDFNNAEKIYKRAEISKMLLHELSHCWGLNDTQAASFAGAVFGAMEVFDVDPKSSGGLVTLSPKQMSTEQIESKLLQVQSDLVQKAAKDLPKYIQVNGYGRITDVEIGKAKPRLIACMMGNDNERIVPCEKQYQYKSASYTVPFTMHTESGKDLTLTLRTYYVYWLKASGPNNGVIGSNIFIDADSPDRKKYIEIRDKSSNMLVQRLDEELDANGTEQGLFLELSSVLRASPVDQVF